MSKYISQFQTSIDEFNNIYQLPLDPENRWIKLGACLPWDKMVQILEQKYSVKGSPSINPRIILGSLIIKHKLNLSDEETVQTIRENPYMQLFCGLDSFHPQPLFSDNAFVEFRKKIDPKLVNEFTDILIRICFPNKVLPHSGSKEKQLPNKGKLKLDATVADQYIRYPNDLSLLNEARVKTEKIIDLLYEILKDRLKVKPRTYRRVAHKRYLAEAKKRQKNKASLRKTIRYLLNCVDRNILTINRLLDNLDENPLTFRQMRTIWIIDTLREQQRQMYNEKTNRCDDRIVSISQPHVRPIIRGKQGKKVEFGSKLGLAMMDGFVKAETINWNAYRESTDLIKHTEAYKELYGYYPKLIQVDKIYGTNENRKWCKERNIKMTVTPKGRPVKKTPYQKRKEKKEYAERNRIEGKIGQSKQGYELNQIKAKLKDTSESWVTLTLFITNLVQFANLNEFAF